MSRYPGLIIDVDVHHQPKSDADILPYLAREWHPYALANPRRKFSMAAVSGGNGSGAFLGGVEVKADLPESHAERGSSYETFREHILDRYTYHRALLTHQFGSQGTHPNQYYARALCSAMNDWSNDQWLRLDKRLLSAVVIPMAQPEEAAKEIRRVGRHPQIASVLVAGNPFDLPLGDPTYHPIFEAAADMNLPITVHAAGARRASFHFVGGRFSTMAMISQSSQQAMHYISSLIVHGVFEKFPSLTVMIEEFGIAWLPALMMRLDQRYEVLRLESPWVKRWPSEYIHDHIALSTQPIEESPDDKHGLADLLQSVDGLEDVLCFSSDFPHFTIDEPDYVAGLLPQSWWKKVFYENAARIYHIPPPEPA